MRRGASEALQRRTLENPPQEPLPHHPRYVHACHGDAWKLQLRRRDGRGPGAIVPYRCRSRHHRGPCQDRWRRVLYARLMAPSSEFQSCPERAAMFWTLTLPPDWHHGANDSSKLAANKAIGGMLRSFRDALNKRLDRMDLPPIRLFWIREVHKSGVPHLHALVVHDRLAEVLRVRDAELAELVEVSANDSTLAPRWLRDMAEAAGFGERFDAQLARSREALAGYASKVCAKMGETEGAALAGEVTKGSQVPEHLPGHCRSFGYSRGFIPPKNRDPAWTGWVEDEHGRKLAPKKTIESIVRDTETPPPGGGLIFDPKNVLASWPMEDWKDAAAIAMGNAGMETAPRARRYRLDPRARPALSAPEALARAVRLAQFPDGWKVARDATRSPTPPEARGH